MKLTLTATIFTLFFCSAYAGKFKEQIDVPKDHDCTCFGYEKKAVKCQWPELNCEPTSNSYKNYVYWCSKLNHFRQKKRKGDIEVTYNRTLTCYANLDVKTRTSITCGLIQPENELASPRSLPVLNYPTNATLPNFANWTSSFSAVKDQGTKNDCFYNRWYLLFPPNSRLVCILLGFRICCYL